MKVHKRFTEFSEQNDVNHFFETRTLRLYRDIQNRNPVSGFENELKDFDFGGEEQEIMLNNEFNKIEQRDLNKFKNLSWMRGRKARPRRPLRQLSPEQQYINTLIQENEILYDMVEENTYKIMNTVDSAPDQSSDEDMTSEEDGSSDETDSSVEESESEDSQSAMSQNVDRIEDNSQDILELKNKKKNLAKRKRKARKTGRPSVGNREIA